MEMTLREARKRRGWDQQTLARESGVDQSTISRIECSETGNPSSETVKRLEVALRVRRGTLVFGQVMEKSA
jgi:transcriptional regulator with XRE-family HTH domain